MEARDEGFCDGFCSPSCKIQRWSLKGGVVVTRERVPQGLRGRRLKPAGKVTKGVGGEGRRRRLFLKDWFIMNNLSFRNFF